MIKFDLLDLSPNNVTVLTLVYNGMPYLPEAVNSVLFQDIPNFNYLIIDDFSNDGSYEYLKSIDDNRITLIRNEVNIGVSQSFNKALEIISTPIKFVHNTSGTLIGMAHIMLPFLILPLYANMRSIDKDCVRAAASLGATPSRAFWTVFFPLSIPGLLAGLLIVFVLCLGFYVTPAVLGGGRVIMAAMKISSNIELYFSWGAASALGVVLLVVTLAILFIASKLVSLDQISTRG